MRILFLFSALTLLLLTGCATMDLSMLDTAVPLQAKQFQFSEYQALSYNPFNVENLVPDTTGYALVNSRIRPNGSIIGVQFNLGLGHNLEFGNKTFTGSAASGGNKTFLKIRLYNKEQHTSIAVIPAFTYSAGEGEVEAKHFEFIWFNENPRHNTFNFNYQVRTYELPLVVTLKHAGDNQDFSTFIFRMSNDVSSFDYSCNDRGHLFLARRDDLNIWRAGLYYNIDIKPPLKTNRITLGFGVEVSPITSTKPSIMPVVALGFKYSDDWLK